MDKSPDAFRTISEVAEHLDTPAHVLRFWESRFPQIRPVKRAGGRRYYRPSDVSLLTGIKRLLHEDGMTIRGVQKILREQGVRHVAGLSGDGMDIDDTPFVEGFVEEAEVADVVVAPQPQPTRAPPSLTPGLTPGLADAMAKAVDHGPTMGARHTAPSTPLPMAEPAQGALLLTPAPVEQVPVTRANAPVDADLDRKADGTSQDSVAAAAKTIDPGQAAYAQAARDEDFDDDEFEAAPTTTLAARIRALPSDAKAGSVGAELLSVVSRLQALRDRMANAAVADRV